MRHRLSLPALLMATLIAPCSVPAQLDEDTLRGARLDPVRPDVVILRDGGRIRATPELRARLTTATLNRTTSTLPGQIARATTQTLELPKSGSLHTGQQGVIAPGPPEMNRIRRLAPRPPAPPQARPSSPAGGRQDGYGLRTPNDDPNTVVYLARDRLVFHRKHCRFAYAGRRMTLAAAQAEGAEPHPACW